MGKPFNPLLGETYQLEQEHFRIVCEQVINFFKIDQQKNFDETLTERTVNSGRSARPPTLPSHGRLPPPPLAYNLT